MFGCQESGEPMDHENISLLDQAATWIFWAMLYMFRMFSDYVAYPALSVLKDGQSKLLPRVEDEILLMSATDLAEKIRSGEVSSHRVVTTFIKRLREINPILNAVTDERYQAALREAQEVDAELEQYRDDDEAMSRISSTKPFLGVPITIKNAVSVKDLGNEAGVYLRKGIKASDDCMATAAMRASGAIPLAVTNTPEFCAWMESTNPLFGRTSNPYDTNRTCGGSSGGEGAVQASCGSPFGVGSDMAGSVRIPAAYNGIFGLKPTRETTDLNGHYPTAHGSLIPLASAGPMCKYAKDLRPSLKILVGPSNSHRMMLDSRPRLDELKVLYIEDLDSSIVIPVRRAIRRRVKSAAFHLASLNNSMPEKLKPGKMAYGFQIYMSHLAKAEDPFLAAALREMKVQMSVGYEMVKLLIGRGRYTLPLVLMTALERVVKKTQNYPFTGKYYKMSFELEKELENILGDNGVLVCPTLPDVAPYHDLSILRTSVIAHTGIWNILGFPAVSVPMGLTKDGMPIGVTVVAGKYKDNVCCEVALELEKKFGGWVPPFETTVDYRAVREGTSQR